MKKEEQINLMNNLAGILIRCFFLTFALLLLWFVFFLAAGDWGYNLHSQWFDLSRADYDLMFYYGMAFIKTCSFVFFLFPYIAIKLVLRKNKKA
jgi:TRAP-type C4-dicarboxylate transport system permease small subunit